MSVREMNNQGSRQGKGDKGVTYPRPRETGATELGPYYIAMVGVVVSRWLLHGPVKAINGLVHNTYRRCILNTHACSGGVCVIKQV